MTKDTINRQPRRRTFRYAHQLTAVACGPCRSLGFISTRTKSKAWVHRLCEACHGVGSTIQQPALAALPPPGTVEKILVMQARYHAGLDLFFPDRDATPESWSDEWTPSRYETTTTRSTGEADAEDE
jgi:hypothetical protein